MWYKVFKMQYRSSPLCKFPLRKFPLLRRTAPGRIKDLQGIQPAAKCGGPGFLWVMGWTEQGSLPSGCMDACVFWEECLKLLKGALWSKVKSCWLENCLMLFLLLKPNIECCLECSSLEKYSELWLKISIVFVEQQM